MTADDSLHMTADDSLHMTADDSLTITAYDSLRYIRQDKSEPNSEKFSFETCKISFLGLLQVVLLQSQAQKN